jgi:hypothetical protein
MRGPMSAPSRSGRMLRDFVVLRLRVHGEGLEYES